MTRLAAGRTVASAPATAELAGAASPEQAVLGLDIGGTKLAAGVVDTTGRVRSFVTEPSRTEEGPDAVLERLLALGHEAVGASGLSWDAVGSVGIGCGGPLDPVAGIVVAPPHLPGWADVPVVELVRNAYGRPAALENDATAAAAGEHRFGAGAGRRNVVYLTLSTGVGGGVVIDGRLYRGATGNGGELGHVTVDWRGRHCRGCGRDGCLEAYVSGTSIAERAREAGMHVDTAEQVAAAARAGDLVASAVWAETGEALACGIISIANVLEPEVVVLGGGVMRSHDILLDRVRALVRAGAMAPVGGTVEIVLSAFGDRVGVVGAAAVALERVPGRERAA